MDQKQLETEVEDFAKNLLLRHLEERPDAPGGAGRGDAPRDAGWPVIKALIHRAVHLAAQSRSAEFCTLAAYLGEMVGHAHGLMHGNDPKAAVHADHLH
jgi:hypothetical protein